jgi:flagellar biosynthetic protein FliR
MPFDTLLGWIVAVLLVGLRVAPALSLAPPFTLAGLPLMLRVAMGLAVSACIVAGRPEAAAVTNFGPGHLVEAACRELFLGLVLLMVLHLTFGALYFAGRTLDIQAGFGLAQLVDPASQNNVPLVGTLFVYAFAAVFFALNGHGELLRIAAASLDAVPIGEGAPPASLARLTGFVGTVFALGMGLAGAAVLCLFLTDLVIGLLTRTAPQLNAMIFGFQVKTVLLLAALPVTFAFAGAMLARMARVTLEALPGLLT